MDGLNDYFYEIKDDIMKAILIYLETAPVYKNIDKFINL